MNRRLSLVGTGVLGFLLALGFLEAFSDAPPAPPAADSSARQPPELEAIAGFSPSPFPGTSSRAGLPSAPRQQAGPPPSTIDKPAYASDQVMARVAPQHAAAVAEDHGLRLLRAPGPSGVVAYGLPRGTSAAAAVAALRDDPRIDRAGLVGLTYGAGEGEIEFSKDDHTWPLYRMFNHKMKADKYSTAGVTIAVLDTGVAYEDHSDDSGTYVQAPSLSHVSFVSPYDFVNDDAHPNDDHQHGTHITSIIASKGDVQGAAPDVDIMPVKVLDATNSGTEVALIDGIHHAVDNGADIINLSLSFSEGYAGSAELMEALETAYDAGVLVVAAAGNNGLAHATWPARSPLVVGVAAAAPKDGDSVFIADYSSYGPGTLLSAPGGDLGTDVNKDGLPDGILGETIDPSDPTEVGLWLMAGSSQAAAFVSAGAAWGIAAGGTAYEVLATLQREANTTSDGGRFDKGRGRGYVEIWDKIYKMDGSIPRQFEGTVALLPYLEDRGSKVRPSVRVTWKSDVESGPDLWISFHGSSHDIVKCTPDSKGICTAKAAELEVGKHFAAGDPLYWWITVDAAEKDDVGHPTRSAIYEGEALQAAIASLEADVGDDAMLGWFWEAATDSDLGVLEPGVSVIDMGTGFASSPMGFFMNDAAVDRWFTVEEVEIDLDGTGFASSPMGRTTVKVLDGTGFASSPMGAYRIASLDGTGFASSPMGSRAKDVNGSSSGGRRVDLRSATCDDDLEDTPLGIRIRSGGWRGSGGEPGGASAVATAASADADSSFSVAGGAE